MAVREQDFDRQSSLIAYGRGLILEASAVIDAFQHLILQELMHIKRWDQDYCQGIRRWIIIGPWQR
jgi:hypothetical protein